MQVGFPGDAEASMRDKAGLVTVLAASSVLICLTGCATRQPHAVSSTVSAIAQSPRPGPVSSETPAAEPALCQDRTLVLSYDPSVLFQATGDRGDAFRIVNHSSHACHLMGYPEITLRDQRGALVPFHYTNGQSQYITERPPEPVTLQPGGWAYVGVAKYRCDLGDQLPSTTITMVLPGQQHVVSVPLTGSARTLGYCAGGPHDPGNTVAVSPIEPTADRLQN